MTSNQSKLNTRLGSHLVFSLQILPTSWAQLLHSLYKVYTQVVHIFTANLAIIYIVMLSISQESKNSNIEDFLSTKEASQIVPYSREYIGRLAREKKVRSALVGGKWIVSLASLQNFHKQAKIEEEILSARLRQERLVEQNISDFIFENKVSDLHVSNSSQTLFAHAVSMAGVMVVGVLFFVSPVLMGSKSSVAQLLNFNQTNQPQKVATFEVVEVTTPLDVENGILLFPKQSTEASHFDPASIFSDEVEMFEDEKGSKYLRVSDEKDSVAIPFVDLPSSYQYYKEVVVDDVVEADF